MKKLIIISLLFITSCAIPVASLDVIDIKTYFPNADIITAQATQPAKVTCPKCKSKGRYIQSLILDKPSLFYSQYSCEYKHMWFIGQEIINGPVVQIILIK